MASINIVLKAVDQYSSTITGLNQGFDLVSKAISGLQAVAEVAWSAIKTGAQFAFQGIKEAVELARLGGAFDEQRNQFENLAKSYGLLGQSVIDTVKETSANTLSEFDSIVIATKAVAAGLQGRELNDALSYVKRWSEATGESFSSAAEKVFTSLSSGRYSVLRQMGLVIENGATLTEVTKAMTDGLKRFGDTGFNTADKLDAMTASTDDFWRKIGQAINQSEGFQKILGSLSDGFVAFVKSFDARAITTFVNIVTGAATELVRVLNVMGVGDWLERQRNEIATWVDDVGKLMMLPLKYLQTVVQELAAFQRNNPLLSKTVYGDFFDPEGLAQAEVSFDKVIRSIERGNAPAKALSETTKDMAASSTLIAEAERNLAEATEAAIEARKKGQDTTAADERLRQAQQELSDIRALYQQSQQLSGENLRRESGIDDLNSELDEMLQKAKAPVEPAAALQTAATRATQPQGIEAATAGLNSQAVLLALGNWLLQHIVNKASTERAPMAILATN